ncbi:hypothetical protein QJ857_gp0867 [Tupanvirus soda lake]|uniref:Uncharacterized protein n=2 Tax=Tupanvirus TaxID=2094720 RepID=A0A6N1NUV7_9VIRU|nr:hypothetical protein QJ857_gp0867 [Tupanvirus soda lake]QKU35183.1 hypothetical protein [Tupanvirus soda lake]
MGYTTFFYGRLTIDKPLDEQIIKKINILETYRCEWTYYIDDNTIGWNGMEKFYQYKYWLAGLINNLLAPVGYILNGRIAFEGEEFPDFGIIKVVDNKIMITKTITYKTDGYKQIINMRKEKYLILRKCFDDIVRNSKTKNKYMSVAQICKTMLENKTDQVSTENGQDCVINDHDVEYEDYLDVGFWDFPWNNDNDIDSDNEYVPDIEFVSNNEDIETTSDHMSDVELVSEDEDIDSGSDHVPDVELVFYDNDI